MIGNVVGNYKITEKIGEGGMGAVFKGVDLMLEREVAIKMLRPELASQPQVVERFRSEAVTLAKLNHPNIATLYSFLRQGEDYFMVMEFVRGETLDSVIRRTGAMPVERAIAMFCHALEGIEHAHKMGIIHRDIKPANMMLAENGSIKVMDFGIARVLGSSRLTRQGSIVGTIEYMSPEQVRGEEGDARSDVYSLGILLYEMLTGRVPFSCNSEFELMKSQIEQAPPPPRTFAAHIPLPIEQAIMRSLAKKPAARYQTAGDFRAVLLSNVGVVTNPLDNTPRAYAAVSEPIKNPPTSRNAGVETRIDADTGGFALLNDNQIKETRLGQAGGVKPVPAGYAPQYAHVQPQPVGQKPSLLSSLNWKHYTAAAGLLLLLISVPVALISRGSAGAPPQAQVSNEESSPAAPSPTPPSAEQSTQSTLPTAVLPESSGQVGAIPGEETNSNSSTSRTARSRTVRGEKPTETTQTPPATVSTPPQNSSTSQQPPPQQAYPPPPPKEEKVAKDTDKKDKNDEDDKKDKKKDKKKSGGFGGFLKKVFGGEKEKKP